jgi:hypothetical protein
MLWTKIRITIKHTLRDWKIINSGKWRLWFGKKRPIVKLVADAELSIYPFFLEEVAWAGSPLNPRGNIEELNIQSIHAPMSIQ